jgi:hypothetical protein
MALVIFIYIKLDLGCVKQRPWLVVGLCKKRPWLVVGFRAKQPILLNSLSCELDNIRYPLKRRVNLLQINLRFLL